MCERFGWTYYEYLSQPYWFIQVIKDKMEIEAEYQKKETEKNNPKSNQYGINST